MSGPGLLTPLINPFTGFSNPDWLPEEFIQDAADLRIFIIHGKDDRLASYQMGVRSRDILLEHGYEVKFRDFDGGHSHPPWDILAHIILWIEGPHKAT
jgi:predicted esterase